MQTDSVKTLAIVVSVFFFTSNLTGSFLPLYFKELGLNVAEIAEILLVTFVVIGFLPLILLKTVKNFERIISYGIFFTMMFFIILIYVRNPIILGLAYGLSTATFWPSFNLLQFRLGESHVRARIISLFSSIIPTLASIIGPAVGGLIIENFDFAKLFAAAVALYFIVFLLSARMKFKPETHAFSIPKTKTFAIFFTTFIILGFTEAYWVAYPFFVHSISGTILNMGLVLAISAVIISTITFVVSWFSDIKRTRVNFAIIGTTLSCVWYFAVAYASAMYQIVALALLSGLASAFSLSWFVHYGDSFGKEHYASILVTMEVGLMIGRILNLAPTCIFISEANYANYFKLLGIISLFMIPLYVASKRKR